MEADTDIDQSVDLRLSGCGSYIVSESLEQAVVPCELLSCSSHYGYTAVGAGTCVRIYKTSSLFSVDGEDSRKPSRAETSLDVGAEITHVKFSPDTEEYLAMCSLSNITVVSLVELVRNVPACFVFFMLTFC